jgi:hypothetical protein
MDTNHKNAFLGLKNCLTSDRCKEGFGAMLAQQLTETWPSSKK